jgi:hypothetical protein
MTDEEDRTPLETGSAPQPGDGSKRLEEAAQEGQLPGIENVEQAEQEGRDTSETDAADRTEADGDPLAAGALLSKISQSR